MEWIVAIAVIGGALWLYRRRQRTKADERQRNIPVANRHNPEARRTKADREIGRFHQRPSDTEWRAEPPRWPRERPYSAVASVPRGAPVTIEYADADGVITERKVVVQRIYKLGSDVYLEGECRLRMGPRTFKAARILKLSTHDETTVPNPVAFLESGDVERRSEPEAHRRVMQRARPGLLALAWIARTDREIDSAEAKIMLDFVEERATIGRSRHGNEFDHALARMRIDDMTPVRGECVSALGRIKAGSPEAALIGDFARRIVASSGTADPAKTRRMDQLLKAIG